VVIPQSSLLSHVKKIFKKIDLGNTDIRFFSPIQFGKYPGKFDITIVEEGHLLKVGFAGQTGKDYNDINRQLFHDQQIHTELDWIMHKSRNVVMIFSQQQRVRPINISLLDVEKYATEFVTRKEYLHTQMRSHGGKLYIKYIDQIFSSAPPTHHEVFPDFELKLFDDFKSFVEAVKQKNHTVGLSRLVSGFSWEWKSRRDSRAYDITIDGMKLKWNTHINNWLDSPNSSDEVGCIYTIQGEDLNYVGVIIGEELIYRDGQIAFNEVAYKDAGAKRRNMVQVKENQFITDEEKLAQIIRVYKILLNRSIMGTYVYVCDQELREFLRHYFMPA